MGGMSFEWASSGVELLVNVVRGTATILSAARLPSIPRADLEPPRMVDEALADLRSDDKELVLGILGPKDRAPALFGFPIAATQYFDWGDDDTEMTRGGPRPIRPDEPDVRSIRLPWADDCTGILLSRTEIGAAYSTGHERRLVSVGLGLYRSDTRQEIAGPLPPGLEADRVSDLVWLEPWAPHTKRQVPYGWSESWASDGQFIGWESPVIVGDPAKRFDIMITGDGFSEDQLPDFDRWALGIRGGLQAIEPFKSLAPNINWHVARVASTDSGIDQCPNVDNPVDRKTFFGVEGGWNDSGCAGYLGLHHVRRLMWVAEQGCGWENVDLAIVIANCEVWGGHAWPSAKTAIVPALSWAHLGLAAHEAGHAIARLAEETICCVEDQPRYGERNKARLPDVGASVLERLKASKHPGLSWNATDTVWWKPLADRPGEIDCDGNFTWVHVLGDPTDGPASPKPRMPSGCPDDAVGAFWGCQDVADLRGLTNLIARLCSIPRGDVEAVIATLKATAGLTPDRMRDAPDAALCDPLWDARGAYYFRPSPLCCMRTPLPPRSPTLAARGPAPIRPQPYCRVCCHLIAEKICDACV